MTGNTTPLPRAGNIGGAPLPALRKRAEFLALRSAPRWREDVFTLQGNVHRAKIGDPPLRIGYTVTRKCGNAVERNRIRRRLRQAAGKAVRELEYGLSGEMVIVARREVLEARFDTLAAKITKGIDRLAAKGNKAGRKQDVTADRTA